MRSVLAASAAVCVLAAAAQALAAPPPASAFGRIPAVVQAAISPDGTKVAVLGGDSDQRVLSIATLDQPDLPQLRLGDVEAVGVQWAGNDYILARLAYWEQVTGRVAYRFERTISVTPQGKAVARLLDNGANNMLVSQPTLGVTTVGGEPRVLMAGLMESGGPSGNANTRMARKGVESSWVLALWSVDPATGRGSIVEKGNYDTAQWAVDPAGRPRVRLEIDEISKAFSIFGRAEGKGQYSPIWKGSDYASRRNYYGYSAPDDAIIMAESGQLVKRRLSDGVATPFGPALDTNPQLVWDYDRRAVVGVSTGAEKPATTWTDPQIGAAHATLTKVFKNRDVELASWSADRTRFVARVGAPNASPVWYLFDAARKEVSPLGEEYPELKDVKFGSTRWISYKARDGLDIPAYLTLPPPEVTAGRKAPIVVMPHGGPRARDRYEFDFTAQFLASRGYAVLQPQFRGSWGFGDAFEKAGEGEWGGKMQTDLQDGVAALAAQGEVDATRACIVGASFGGYSALAGASLYPDSYRCAASIAGISDLGQLLLEQGRAYGRDSASTDELRSMIGAASPAKLAATSPIRHVSAVKAPILLIHGDKDTVVLPGQSQRMAEALKAAGKPHELVILEGENHYLSRASTRTRTLEALEAFLARHLPVS